MRPTWYDTLKYWNGKEILRECKDKNRLCVHANVWNTCVDKPCEKGSKLLGKEADQFIVDEANAYTKGDPMTNREWLECLSVKEMAEIISAGCDICTAGKPCYGFPHGSAECVQGIKKWLGNPHEEPKKELTQAQLCEAFELKFGKRRAISLDEIKEVTKEIFK